ncbi:TPM domain-containing protein [Aestuariicoccus sp. MJ-SS9]|uniref:TPM domain-containing protein n=1 Tax=Aestuariicoccus sp. MJ-SS9 TaxID=3079855 RepID=UPI0029153BF6|nr:TPM domain-containing protein [Aestuariicoccus sp. MJ-SS9]MDU8913462.1 TPM domain-containing protein [Aestuariicoccus sp. MJ-SS9]
MTKYDLRIAGMILALVVALGLALGYGVGLLTRGGPVPGQAPSGPAAFDPAGEVDGRGYNGTPIPGYRDVYINDYADLLDDPAETRIRDDLIELYDRTGVEMTVLTIDSMGTYGFDGTIESFATQLFNTWGIGNADRNDGVLVLVARYDRQMRIELGAGYGRARDGDMQRVIDNAFLPAFRRDAYQEGIETGVDATVFEIAGVYPGGYDDTTLERGWSVIWRVLEGFGSWLYALVAPPLGFAAFWLRRYFRNRPRACTQCGTMMIRAGEEADDEHLDGGQRLEEFLKSVDYDVWHCPGCGHMTINRYKGWFSGFSTCPECAYRTLETTSTVLQSATKTRTGRKRLDYDCRNCDYNDSEIRTIPKISDSSSSGSSRSSFGGGSSSGGGASGSW